MSHREIEERIEKVRRDVMLGRPERRLKPQIDPYDKREHTRDVLAGRERDPAVWCRVMEYWGFRWYEPQQLDEIFGQETYIPEEVEGVPNSALYWQRPHAEGQWRNDVRRDPPPPALRYAFTLPDLISLYEDPEGLDEFLRGEVLSFAQARERERSAAERRQKLTVVSKTFGVG